MLVIHPTDKTTETPSERIMMLGHGSNKGLYFRMNDEEEDFDGIIVGHPQAYYLRKHCGGIIGIWCHAMEFAKKEGLHGLFSSMIISEMSEAEEYGVPTDKENMDRTNRIMFTQLRRLLDDGTPLHEIPERLKALDTTQSELSRFNYERFYSICNKLTKDMTSIFRKIRVRWHIWRGQAIDIWSKSVYPADVLSNLCSNGFRFDGVVCGSMEGFLQSLKQQDINKQRQICSMKGKNAKKQTSTGWQTDQIVCWKGKAIDRQSGEFTALVHEAYNAMFEQSERFRTALMATRGMILYHTKGEGNPYKTILTEQEFCGILTELRENYDHRDKTQELITKSVQSEPEA